MVGTAGSGVVFDDASAVSTWLSGSPTPSAFDDPKIIRSDKMLLLPGVEFAVISCVIARVAKVVVLFVRF
jgi:hypothetical protein